MKILSLGPLVLWGFFRLVAGRATKTEDCLFDSLDSGFFKPYFFITPPPLFLCTSCHLSYCFDFNFILTKSIFSTELQAKVWSFVFTLFIDNFFMVSWQYNEWVTHMLWYISQLYYNNLVLRSNHNREWLDSRRTVHVGRKVLKHTHFCMLK